MHPFLIAAAFLISGPQNIRILFIGNSHTGVNNVPSMVRSLIESDGGNRKATIDTIMAGHLNDIGDDEGILNRIRKGRWNVVVLQGAMVSMSRRISYPQDGGINLAKIAKQSGARVLCYSEWPRRDIDETIYTENVYREIADAVGGQVVPAGRVFDEVRHRNNNADYWQPDGNHARLPGSFIAAESIYTWISGADARTPTWHPDGVQTKLGLQALEVSKAIWKREHLKKQRGRQAKHGKSGHR